MNKYLLTGLLSCCLSANAAELLPMPSRVAGVAVPSVSDVAQRIERLNDYIGSYPPRFANAKQRAQVYEDWTGVIRQLWKLEEVAPRAESTIGMLADAYRQGHNLDVEGAAPKAMQALEQCLAAFPDSVGCHWVASYFYLSIHPSHVPKGEASLLRLRQLVKPQPNREVERGMAFAYLYQQKNEAALKQMDYYLTLAPGDAQMRKIRDAVASKQVEVKYAD